MTIIFYDHNYALLYQFYAYSIIDIICYLYIRFTIYGFLIISIVVSMSTLIVTRVFVTAISICFFNALGEAVGSVLGLSLEIC